MTPLPGTPLPELPVRNLKWIRDLVYFEGPLLSEFHTDSGDLYLFHWCDSDSQANRWLVVRTTARLIARVQTRKVSLHLLLKNYVREGTVYFVDYARGRQVRGSSLALLNEIPEQYFPRARSRIPVEDARRTLLAEREYPVLIDGRWNTSALSSMPKLYREVYSVLYLAKRRPPGKKVRKLPWQGGFSVGHFYDSLPHFMPRASSPDPVEWQYASPGIIKFNGDPDVSSAVAESVVRYIKERDSIDDAYRALESYIGKQKLNKRQPPGELTPEETEQVQRLGSDLATHLKLVPWETLVALVPDGAVFETSKILMAHFRRVRDLAAFQLAGLAEFIPTESLDDEDANADPANWEATEADEAEAASARETIEELLPELASRLVDGDEKVTGRIAESNATGFGLDDYIVESVEYADDRRINFFVSMTLIGEQDPDQFSLGHRIELSLNGVAVFDGSAWVVESQRVRKCLLVD